MFLDLGSSWHRNHWRMSCVWLTLLMPALASAKQGPNESANTIVLGGIVETCDGKGTQFACMAIRKGVIQATGTVESLQRWIGAETVIVKAEGGYITPGFTDSHLHFVGLGESLERLDLRTASTWDAIIDAVEAKARELPSGTWIQGRGWHQEKWTQPPNPQVEGYPLHAELSRRVPDHPVLLIHASGHACIVNQKAMELSKIDEQTVVPDGGEILHDAQGKPTGVLRENAQRLVDVGEDRVGRSQLDQRKMLLRAVERAGEECLRHGITSVHDAGITFAMADALGALADDGKLPLRVYAMIREGSGSLLQNMKTHRWENRGERLTIRSVKASLDGALGPHGAWLLDPYQDLPQSRGLNTLNLDELEKIAKLCWKEDWQLCVHAIGDRANREVLDLFERALLDRAKDHRWRIEHAQHVHPNDLSRFAELKVIPAMQANHCTSDALFVIERLGERRAAEGAYMWRTLIDFGSIVPNGTDAPVELVDPRPSLYAAATRKLANGEAFYPEQCMTRYEALLSYTLWPAMASFEEQRLGSLEPGKRADFVIWDRNLLEGDAETVLGGVVREVWIDGQRKYPRR